jgi:hypothetical protein
MEIEEGGPTEALIEPANSEAEWEECPCCGECNWLRVVAAYATGACWVIYCGGCGKKLDGKWNRLP